MVKPKKFNYVAFYDLDHTILEGNSATHLVEEARQREIMTARQYNHAVFLSVLYKLRIGDPIRMINRMLTWLRGLEESVIRQLCLEVFHADLKQLIRKEIVCSLEEHKSANGAVVLLSSATAPICEPISLYLAMDDLICTRLKTNDGILTGQTDGKLVYGPEKKKRMFEFCRHHRFDPGQAYYYGDSFTDRYVMKAVGNPVAISPDKRLLKLARSKNWPVLTCDR